MEKRMTEEKKDLRLEISVTNILREFGVPAHLNGYVYLRKGIIYLVKDMGMARSITKGLYYDLAKDCDSTVNKIERSIRNAIEVAWERGNEDTFDKYFGYSQRNGRNRPCNSEFMVQIADYIRLNQMATMTA